MAALTASLSRVIVSSTEWHMRESMSRRIGLLVACALAVVACDRSATKTGDADVGGSIIVATQAEPVTLLPPLVSAIDEGRPSGVSARSAGRPARPSARALG